MVNDHPPIGIIQGRLTPSPDGRLQFFPKNNWRAEFSLAHQIGLQLIEPIFHTEDYPDNPILGGLELEEMKLLAEKNSVAIRSVCVDFFMDYTLHRSVGDKLALAQVVLALLIKNCRRIGIKTILIPILERSEVVGDNEKTQLINNLTPFLVQANAAGVDIAFESSLPAVELKELIENFRHPRVKVYYDVGNAASMGFDVPKEILLLKDLIVGVHVKDRKLGGSSVPLGTGAANFPAVFAALKAINYRNPLILQAARGEQDLVVANAKRNIQFIRDIYRSM